MRCESSLGRLGVPDRATPMDRAVELAALGPAWGGNPRVGAVIVGNNGAVLGEGYHHGAGTPHAEVDALRDAAARGNDVAGAHAYVTLEPCNHTGRTGPCSVALADAGIGRVTYAVADPNAEAAGGAQFLAGRGIPAVLDCHAGAAELNRRWLASVRLGRPYVIVKWGATLDGRIAAPDGTSQWITGPQARGHAHTVRAEVDAIAVGTGTVVEDDPELSARPAGVEAPHQPLRVIVGRRETRGARVWRDDNAVRVGSHDPADALAAVELAGGRTLLVEGGGTLIGAFLDAGLVDEVHAYLAPAVLGAGTPAVVSSGTTTLTQMLRGQIVNLERLGEDVLVAVARTEKD